MKIIHRIIQKNIERVLFKGKIIIIYGARQVGKTTLIKEIQKKRKEKSFYLNCDEPDIRQALTDKSSTELKEYIGDNKLLFIDEAQRVANIGLTLKLLVDNFPGIQAVVTSSSSFDLSNQVVEPLTGRKYEFWLYPFSMEELKQIYSEIEIKRILEQRILYGMYPEVAVKSDKAAVILKSITRDYLYKDVLQYQRLKSPEALEKLLQALALQIGNEVSYNELSGLVGIDKKTVARYIEILEKAFIIFRLNPFSRNLRKELSKLRKIYFYDTGVRNAIINNLNPFHLRQDVGVLWENFFISEKVKNNSNRQIDKRIYFWRTLDGQEVDLLELEADRLDSYEIKWQKDKAKPPVSFTRTYPDSSWQLINKDNFFKYLV